MSIAESLFKKAAWYHTFMPRIVDVEVTRACNLKCIGCPRATEQSIAYRGELKHLDPTMLGRILEAIPTVRLVNFIGDGEPLFNPHFNYLVSDLHLKGIKLMFTTNGTLVKQSDVDCWAMYDNAIRSVTVSLDSLRPDKFEQLRPGASYQRVMSTLAMLREARIPTRINMVLVKENENEIEDFINYFSHTDSEGTSSDVNFTHPIFAQGSDLEGKPYTRASVTPAFRRCLYPFAWPYITLEGDVYACCYMVGGNRQEWFMGEAIDVPNDNYRMGNIYQQDFRDIWYSMMYRALRWQIKRTEHLGDRQTSIGTLGDMRRHLDDYRFAYCTVCLYRWGCSC